MLILAYVRTLIFEHNYQGFCNLTQDSINAIFLLVGNILWEMWAIKIFGGQVRISSWLPSGHVIRKVNFKPCLCWWVLEE
jgi:hypothetical protein